jgi:hypothetical protein
MCFNAEVSISTYLIGMMGCFLLFQRKHYIVAITFAWVVQMQLIEYFLWKSQNCRNPFQHKRNVFFSKIGIIINHLEPIILYLSILYFAKTHLPYWVHLLVLVYMICAIFYMRGAWLEQSCVAITEISSPHLYWKWNTFGKFYQLFYTLFLCTVCLLFLYVLPPPYNQLVSLLVLFFFLLSYFI